MLFNNSTKPHYSRDEGIVMQVDVHRQVCKVVTTNGQKLDNVQWLSPYGGNDRSGDRFTPRIGDKVLLDTGMGYPVILGALSRPQSGSQSYPLRIDTEASLVDTGNYAPGLPGMKSDASKPEDILLGDRIIGSQGGGIIGLLKAGSLLLRSSRAAEIFLSRVGDLARIVGRNLEVFTDLSTEVFRNFQGRVYRYFGASNSFQESRDGAYRYHQYIGDVVAAETVKARYHEVDSAPPKDDILFKEQITDGEQGPEVMHRTLNLKGYEEVVITGEGTHTRVYSTNNTIVLTFNEDHVVTIDSGKINLHHKEGTDILINEDGVFTTCGGHFCNVTRGGIQLG